MLELLTALFNAIFGLSKAVEKGLPSDKIQEGKFEVTKPTLTEKQIKKIADERNRLADEMFGDLVGHPELNVADKVYFEATQLSNIDKILLIEILENRLNASQKYNRLKNKKSKFKL